MAQTYEIDIERFNGTDYDTLLPTPATHASTHLANGTDPIVCQTGNYGNQTVTSTKIATGAIGSTQMADNAVTWAKLANAARSSPVVQITNATPTINFDYAGQTLVLNGSALNFVLTINNTGWQLGNEAAILNYQSTSAKIVFSSGINVIKYGEDSLLSAPIFALDLYAMVAIKKIASNLWLISGPAEVVS